jgi:polyisoprenoid-binding protein YceI
MTRIRTALVAGLTALGMTALLLATPARAEVHTYQIDADHTDVGFTVRHMFTKLHGRFDTVSGAFQLDPTTGKVSAAKGVVETKSVDTHHEKRDGHLRSPDFFDADKYPTLTFTGKVFKPVKDGTEITGDLTMRGVTKTVTFKTQFLGAAADPFGNTRASISATTRVNRKDFGIDFNKVLDNGGLLIGDDVDIDLEIEGIQK